MDTTSDTMLKARVIAMAQLGIIVERIDLSSLMVWISVPEDNTDSQLVVEAGKTYSDTLAKQAKSTLFQDGIEVPVRVLYKTRAGDVWNRARENAASAEASRCISMGVGWQSATYNEYRNFVAAAKTARVNEILENLRNRSGQNQRNPGPSIIDVPNFAENDK